MSQRPSFFPENLNPLLDHEEIKYSGRMKREEEVTPGENATIQEKRYGATGRQMPADFPQK